jgi:hypothetical protein
MRMRRPRAAAAVVLLGILVGSCAAVEKLRVTAKTAPTRSKEERDHEEAVN